MTGRRAGLLVLFGTVAIAAIAFGVWRWRVSKQESAAARGLRQTVITMVAPAPLPTSLPLSGPDGVDADGYPKRWVDRAALRSLLHHRKFAELTAYFERFQTEFESDPRKEYWPFDAAAAFGSVEPELRQSLDAWVASAPGAFAPLLARGTYFTSVGFARRGTKWAKDTPNADFDAMADAFAPARADLKRALLLRPRAFAAHRGLIQMEAAGGTPAAARRTADEAIELCRACYQIRVTFLVNARPRWGGSHEIMRDFAAAAPVAENRRLALLAGYLDWDLAETAARDKNYDVAMAAIERANALGENCEFLLARGKIKAARADLEGALRDIDRALVLRPGLPDLLFERAAIHDQRASWELGGRDLLEAMRVDATDSLARWLMPRAVQGLLADGWKKHSAGDSAAALRMLDLAADLDPSNGDVQRWRAAVVLGPASTGGPPTPAAASAPNGDAEIERLEARAKSAPDDFEAHRSLDYALARRGAYERVVTMWNDYLSRHPREGRAYLERGGAHLHLRHLRDAKGDAQKACELGVSEGCARAAQLPSQ
jgi:tetratricopeptide (TPR) repeat protein